MTLLDLPNEVLLFVGESLPFSGLQALRMTSKRLNSVLKRINRRRITLNDIQDLAHLQQTISQLGDKWLNAIACKVSAASILPISTISSTSESESQDQDSIYDVLATAPGLNFFTLALLPFSDVNISFIPPYEPNRHPLLTNITHLQIINFRVSPSFLSAFPNLIELTVALVLQPEENSLVQLQYRPRDIATMIPYIPETVERLNMTVTNVTPELVAAATKRLKHLTSLSFVWYPEQDVTHGGVEVTDCSKNLHEYIIALSPARQTLRSLHLPLCFGRQSPIPTDDEELGSGIVFTADRQRAFLPPSRAQVSVSQKDILSASQRIVTEGRMEVLERIGWVIPQGIDGTVPHLLVDTVKTIDIDLRPAAEDDSGESGDSGAETSESEGYTRGRLLPRSFSAPIASGQALLSVPERQVTSRTSSSSSLFKPKQPSNYTWELSLEWKDGYAWPPSEMEEVFPLGVE